MIGQLHDLTALPNGKELRNPLHRRLGRSQRRFWRLGERTNPLPQLGFEAWTVCFDWAILSPFV